jgi:lipid A 3-O-deacylase
MQKLLLFYIFWLGGTGLYAQTVKTDVYSKEIGLTTENDAYLFSKNDAYYTNGFFLNLRSAYEKKGNKLIRDYQIGQMIFTPLDRKNPGPSGIDRPYCGYLFFQFKQTAFRKKAVIQYNLGIGQVGSASGGEDVQNSYHKLLGYSRFSGWQYQIKNAFGADAGFTYAHTLINDSTSFKIIPVAQANLGMDFTNAKLGAYLCIGSFEDNRNSALWNARMQTKSADTYRKFELFFYIYPQVILQGYNSTVEGGLLNKSSTTEVLGKLEQWMFQDNLGMCYAQGRWTTNLAFIYQSREAEAQEKPQRYVSVQVSYRLH